MIARRILRPFGAVLVLMVLFLAWGVPALAAENDPVAFSIAINPTSMTEPGKVQVTLNVSHTGGDAIENNQVILLDPAGQVVGSFGDGGYCTLVEGSPVVWQGEWQVTEEDLDKGEIVYTLKYHLQDAWGEWAEHTHPAAAKVEYTGERIKLTVGRTITPEVVRKGETATVTYELYNSGNVDLKDISIKENISKTPQKVTALAAGEKKTVTFETKIGAADLTSSAKITYKAKGQNKSYTHTVEDAVIPLAKSGLSFNISSPVAGVNIGQAARLVITFTNEGNITYSNVSVKDAKKGEILTNITIPAGATVVEEKEFILNEPTTFKLTATLPNNTGNTPTMTSNELMVSVFDPEREMRLTLNLHCDQETIPQMPAPLRFELTVTNNSNIKAEKIEIYHGSTFITNIPSLEPGASTTLTRDFTVSQGGKFCFTASVQDALKNTVTFDSNTLEIRYARPTAAPTKRVLVTSSPAPIITPAPAEPMMVEAKSVLTYVLLGLGGLFAVSFLLFVASTIVRMQKKSKSAAAYDHLELAERRSYTDPADQDGDDGDVPMDEPRRMPPMAQPPMAAPYQPPMAQPIQRPMPARPEGMNEAPAQDYMPTGDGEGGYRLSRSDEEEAPAAERPVYRPMAPVAPYAAPAAEDRPVPPVAERNEAVQRPLPPLVEKGGQRPLPPLVGRSEGAQRPLPPLEGQGARRPLPTQRMQNAPLPQQEDEMPRRGRCASQRMEDGE